LSGPTHEPIPKRLGLLHPRALGLASHATPKVRRSNNHVRSKVFGFYNHARLKRLEFDNYVRFDKQLIKRKIMYFSCQEKEKKEKRK
jgi:hypothetical protein